MNREKINGIQKFESSVMRENTPSIHLLCCNSELLRIADEHCPFFPPNPLAVHECVVPGRSLKHSNLFH